MKTLTDHQIISILNMKELLQSVKSSSISNSTGTFVDIHLNQDADLTECKTAIDVLFPECCEVNSVPFDNEDGTYNIHYRFNDPSGIYITVYAHYTKEPAEIIPLDFAEERMIADACPF